VATMAREKLRLLLRLRLLTDTAMAVAMEATAAPMVFLTAATDALTEDTVATDVATMARGKLRLLLRLRLLTDTAMAAAMEAMVAPMVFLLTVATEDTVATDALTEDMVATDVATMAREKLRLLLRLRLLTDTAMAVAMEAMAAPMV